MSLPIPYQMPPPPVRRNVIDQASVPPGAIVFYRENVDLEVTGERAALDEYSVTTAADIATVEIGPRSAVDALEISCKNGGPFVIERGRPMPIGTWQSPFKLNLFYQSANRASVTAFGGLTARAYWIEEGYSANQLRVPVPLELWFHTVQPATFARRRAPYLYTAEAVAIPVAEQIICNWPHMGRYRASLVIDTNTADVTIRIMARARRRFGTVTNNFISVSREVELLASTVLTTGTGRGFEITEQVDELMLRALSAGGGNLDIYFETRDE